MNLWNRCRCCLKSKFRKFTALHPLLHVKTFSTHTPPLKGDGSLNTAVSVLDIVSPKTSPRKNQQCTQLIQDFLQDRLHELNRLKSSKVEAAKVKPSRESASPEPMSESLYDVQSSPISFGDDPVVAVFELHRKGVRMDSEIFSYAISACGFGLLLHCGTQLHCLAVRDGLFTNVYVGSSLISMYSKCRDLSSARRVLEELPVKNVVSWTALISGFAQECQVDVCLELYQQMRNSSLKPNDYTLTSLLSACVGCGSLGHGKSAHSQAIVFGLNSYIHVTNALISMYSKCGNIVDALSIFEILRNKDIVSWNSMIAGYALHGLARKAIDLFEEMRELKVKPDGISFLGVLSSCRHSGLVNEGKSYFNSMVENGVHPDLSHYSCIVDLLGRAGLVIEAHKFVLDMPVKPNAVIWGSLLSSCRLHDNVWIGIEAAENRLVLEPSCAATHVQLAKLYARVGLWDRVAKVWKAMKDVDLRTEPGYSWIEIGKKVHRFRADDTANSEMNGILVMLDDLMGQMTVDSGPQIHEELDVDMFLVS